MSCEMSLSVDNSPSSSFELEKSLSPSSIGTSEISSPPSFGPIRLRKNRKNARKTFCFVCEKNLIGSKGRTQGPTRHIQQSHLKCPMFFCPHCEFTSNYDKAQVRTHMGIKHKDMGGIIREEQQEVYKMEMAQWFKRCFGVSNDGTTTSETAPKASPSPVLSAASDRPIAPLTHSIDRILAPENTVATVTQNKTEHFSENIAAVTPPLSPLPMDFGFFYPQFNFPLYSPFPLFPYF